MAPAETEIRPVPPLPPPAPAEEPKRDHVVSPVALYPSSGWRRLIRAVVPRLRPEDGYYGFIVRDEKGYESFTSRPPEHTLISSADLEKLRQESGYVGFTSIDEAGPSYGRRLLDGGWQDGGWRHPINTIWEYGARGVARKKVIDSARTKPWVEQMWPTRSKWRKRGQL